MKKLLLTSLLLALCQQFVSGQVNQYHGWFLGDVYYAPHTVATLPAYAPVGRTAGYYPWLYATDVITSRGRGGYVYWDGSNWRTRENIVATANYYQWLFNARTAFLNVVTPVTTATSVADFQIAGQIGGTAYYSGTGANLFGGATATAGMQGLFMTPGTTTTGGSTFYGITVSAPAATDTNSCGCLVAVSALCDGTDKYWAMVGANDNGSAFTWPGNGGWFAYDMYNANSIVSNATFSATWTNNWICVSAQSSTFDYHDSGLPVNTSLSALSDLRVVITSGAIIFYTNAVACYTNSTAASIPTTHRIFYPTVDITKTAGTTARYIYVWEPFVITRHATRSW